MSSSATFVAKVHPPLLLLSSLRAPFTRSISHCHLRPHPHPHLPSTSLGAAPTRSPAPSTTSRSVRRRPARPITPSCSRASRRFVGKRVGTENAATQPNGADLMRSNQHALSKISYSVRVEHQAICFSKFFFCRMNILSKHSVSHPYCCICRPHIVCANAERRGCARSTRRAPDCLCRAGTALH